MESIAIIARTRGLEGIRNYLQDHKMDITRMFEDLASSVVLYSGQQSTGRDQEIGIKIEALDMYAQRLLWSVMLQDCDLMPMSGLKQLVTRYLRFSEQRCSGSVDGVCLSLAQTLASKLELEKYKDDRELDDETSDTVWQELQGYLYIRPIPHSTTASEQMRLLTRFNTKSQEVIIPATIPKAQTRMQETIEEEDEIHKTKSEDDSSIEETPRKKQRTEDTNNTAQPETPGVAVKELEAKASLLAKELSQISSAEAQSNRAEIEDVTQRVVTFLQSTVASVDTTQETNEQTFSSLCERLKLYDTSDEVLYQVASSLVQTNWSSRYAAVFLHTSVLPKIRAATSVISRVLLQTALLFGQQYTSTLLNALLVPLAMTPDIASAQGEAVTRILRNGVPIDLIDSFITASLSGDGTTPVLANEVVVLFLQNALNKKPALTSSTVDKLVDSMEMALEVDATKKSAKFATLLFTLVSKYPTQCGSHKEPLDNIAQQLTSLMAKSTLRAIQKLKTH